MTSASQKGIMDKAWELIQKKTFTKWCNNHLMRRFGKDTFIKDVQNDFVDGILLMKLINALYDIAMKKHNPSPKMRVHLIENVNLALAMVKEAGIKTHFLSAENLVDCDLKMILGLIWTIILDYQIKGISVEELNAKEGLLLWCKKKTAGYKDVAVDNFHTSFQDGLAFCALIHKHRPDLLDFNSLNKDNKAENLKLAFDVAEQKLGIPRLLEVEDMIDVARPDERSVMTYVSEYFHYFASQNQNEVAGRRIAKLAKTTQQNDKLKADYSAHAQALVDWIKSTTNAMNSREFDNTLAGIEEKLGEFDQYKKATKPTKTAEKIEVEQIYNNLTMKLRGAGRPAYQPPAGLSVKEIGDAWEVLGQAEHDREAALREEYARQQKLDTLLKRFHNKVAALEEFAKGKENFLKSGEGEKFDTVAQVQVRIKMNDGLQSELDSSKKRLDEVNHLGQEIVNLKSKDAPAVEAKLAELSGRWANLGDNSRNRQSVLAAELQRQQKMEDFRLEFAKLAKEYNRWLKDAQAKARDENFGLNLEQVIAFKGTLTQEEEELKSTSTAKKSALQKLDQEMKAIGVTYNNYTPFTVDDLSARESELHTLLEKRKGAFEAELARQQTMEAKRKEFAAAAQAFIDFLASQRNAINSVEGDPEPQIEKIKEIFQDGQEAQAHLAKLGALDAEMTSLGITENRHTQYAFPVCQNRLLQHSQFVENLLASLREDVVLNNKLLELRRAWEQKEKEEGLRIDFANNANELNAFFQNANSLLNDPVASNTVEAAQSLKHEFEAVVAEKGAKETNLNNARSLDQQLKAVGVTENPLSELTSEQIEHKWAALGDGVQKYKNEIEHEISRQETNEALRKEFAQKATALNSLYEKELASISNISGGDAEVDLASLRDLIPSVEGSKKDLQELRNLYQKITEAKIVDNKHTNLTLPDIEVKGNQLANALQKKIQLLEAQVASKKNSEISPEQAKEFKECFEHFDRNKTGALARDEFKACLSSLGEHLTDVQLDIIFQEFGGTQMPYEGFQRFMLKRVSDTDSQDEIISSFKLLAGNGDFVTEVQMRPVFDNDTMAFLLKVLPPYPGVPGAYDYKAWVNTAYHS